MPDAASPIDPEALLAEASWVRRLAQTLVDDAHDADDLAQETWRIALESPPRSHASRPALRMWLSRVVHNLGRQSHRDESARAWHERRAARGEAAEDSIATEERVDLQRRLAEAILSLDEPYRSAIRLRYIDGLSTADLARRQNISLEAARQRLSRGIATLRARLDREYGERSAWGTICIALARSKSPVGTASVVGSGGVMGINLKLLAGSAALLAIAGVLVWSAISRGRMELGSEDSSSHPLAANLDKRPARRSDRQSFDDRDRVAVAPAESSSTSILVIDREHDLHGVVLDPDGTPLPGAQLMIYRGERDATSLTGPSPASLHKRVAEARTDDRGEFAVPLPRGYAHDLEVRAPDCSTEYVLSCNAGERVVVRMHHKSALIGRIVRQADGVPIQSVEVHVKIYPDASWRVADLRTDQDGRYRVEDVPITDLLVWARMPGKMLPATARILPAEGQVTEQDFSLALGATLHGKVIDSIDGHPIENAEVCAGAFWDGGVARSDAGGEFTLSGLNTPGTWAQGFPKIYARADGYALVPVPTGNPEGTSFAPNFVIRLPREVRVQGRVVDAADHPLEGALLRVPFPNMAGNGVVASTDASGRFVMKNLGQYAHEILVSKDGFGDKIVRWNTDPTHPAQTDFGDIRLQPAATLSGTLIDDAGRSIPNLRLFLFGGRAIYPPGSLSSRQCRTDDLGRFTFIDLAGADYSLEASWPSYAASTRVKVTLADGEDRRGVEIVLPGGSDTAGVVRGSDDQPLARVQISFEPEPPSAEGINFSYATTDSQGRFLSQGMPAGTYTMMLFPENEAAVAGGMSRASPKIVTGVQAGQRDVQVRLEPGAWLRGTVLDSSARPAEHVFVFVYDAVNNIELWRRRSTDALGRFTMFLDRTRTWNIVAAPPLVDARGGNPRPDLEPTHQARADGVAPGGPDIELRLPAR